MELIKQQILPYLKLKIDGFDKQGLTFTCPKCRNNPATATMIPKTDKVRCCICRVVGDIYDIVPLVESTQSKDREDINKYISDLFNLNVILQTDEDDIIDFYERACFDMVPVIARGKAPIEKAWTTRNHTDKKEWLKWLSDGLNIGVKTGKISDIIVIDVDTPEVPEEAKHLLTDDTLVQKTNKGFHFFYKYDPDLPKTRIQDLKIDIETDGGQVVLTPSKVDDVTRTINFKDIKPMSAELKTWLQERIKQRPKQNLVLPSVSDTVPSQELEGVPEGGRHHTMMHLAGIFRKKFNREDTMFALDVMNKRMMNPPLTNQEFRAVINSVDTYRDYDNQELVNKILKYIEVVEEASPMDIKDALGLRREPIDKALKHLTQEGFLIKKRKQYRIVKKAIWRDTFVDDGEEIDFTMPYFHDYARFRNGDMIVIGAKTGVGKTHLAMNIIKDLVQQGIKPNYISLESGSRWATIAKGLGMAEKQFNWCVEFSPEGIELEDDAITIIDWLLPDVYADTDKLFKKFAEQLVKHSGILIIFVQLMNNEESSFFAKNMIAMFPAFVAKFLYSDDTGTKSKFMVEKMREPLGQYKAASIPCKYDFASKRLIRIEDIERR